MGRKGTPQSREPARLLISTNEAREKLVSRRELGVALYNSQAEAITSSASLDSARQAFAKWHSYNGELLRRIFDSDEYAEAYANAGVSLVMSLGQTSISTRAREHLDLFKKKLEFLDNLAERIELIDLAQPEREAARMTTPTEKPASPLSNSKVFVVHGQDNETKIIVARFIEHCGLHPIILHEQLDQGLTVIEKFEENADVGFAVVLLTPDDVGRLATAPEGALKPRARQNVILELGYFIGRLGRNRVCALRRGDTELPSDFAGVIYTPYDGADEGWKIKLAREMRAAGLNVDLNAALG